MPGLTGGVPENDHHMSIQSVNRVYEFPVVASVIGYATDVYGKVKDSNMPLVGRTLGAAEATAKFAAAQAYPMAAKFGRPISIVDSYACKGLDALEGSFPVVKQPTEEIIANAKSYVAVKVQPTVTMISHAKSFGTAKVGEAVNTGKAYVNAVSGYGRDKVIQAARNQYGQLALKNFDRAVTKADEVLDKFMPEGGEMIEERKQAGDENWDPALVPIAHAAALSDKFRRRIYSLAMVKAKVVQKRVGHVLGPLTHPLSFVEYVRTQLTSGSQTLSEKTNELWKETGSLTPRTAVQALSDGVGLIEGRTTTAARRLVEYLWANYVPDSVADLLKQASTRLEQDWEIQDFASPDSSRSGSDASSIATPVVHPEPEPKPSPAPLPTHVEVPETPVKEPSEVPIEEASLPSTPSGNGDAVGMEEDELEVGGDMLESVASDDNFRTPGTYSLRSDAYSDANEIDDEECDTTEDYDDEMEENETMEESLH